MSSQVQERDERLFAFFDGELDESERASVEAELAGDESLAATLADLSFMREIVVGDRGVHEPDVRDVTGVRGREALVDHVGLGVASPVKAPMTRSIAVNTSSTL